MTGKYTIKIDPDLHDWFKHAAIDARRTISELVVEAMEAYRGDYVTPSKDIVRKNKKSLSKVDESSSVPSSQIVDLFNPKPKAYVKKIFKPGTHELNDTAEAQKVDKAANKIVRLIAGGRGQGVSTVEIEDFCNKHGFDFALRRDALSYLNHNKVIVRRRGRWIHTKFIVSPGGTAS